MGDCISSAWRMILSCSAHCLAQVVFFAKLTDSMAVDWGSASKRVGGRVHLEAAGAVSLRVMVDHSAVEVYTSSGEVLTTR